MASVSRPAVSTGQYACGASGAPPARGVGELFFVVFYMAVVWIQADVENAYRVTSSVQRVLLPRDDDGEVRSTAERTAAPPSRLDGPRGG